MLSSDRGDVICIVASNEASDRFPLFVFEQPEVDVLTLHVLFRTHCKSWTLFDSAIVICAWSLQSTLYFTFVCASIPMGLIVA